jgi:N-methylhydantoinase A
MIIGIDVGGTHVDGVLLDGTRVAAKSKVSADQSNLQESIITLLASLLPEDRTSIKRIHLSTTLCTNAIVNNKLEEVGMFVQAGPGMNPDFLKVGDNLHFLDGTVDHRGHVQRPPSKAEMAKAVKELQGKDISSIGIVTKFSHRNNEHELWARDQLANGFTHFSLGHRLSGMPNFPRRVYTTWLNSSLKSRFTSFKEAMEEGFRQLDLTCPCYILKADGGTIPFVNACEFPCQSIHSGPSASVMGALALFEDLGDTVLLDIGGTTTDISIFADNIPLLEPYGATVAGRPTLIRALQTKSIGLGGDSCVSFQNGQFTIGPDKKGMPMALGGGCPTPTDAMIVLGTIEAGSLDKAAEAMQSLRPLVPAEETAAELLRFFVSKAREAVEELLEEIFSRPVYTVSAILKREKIKPQRLVAIGGPAQALHDNLVEGFGIDCDVPADYEVANAIGAARARLTVQASLYADTGTGTLSIPEISCMESIKPRFTMMEAETRLAQAITTMAAEMGMTEIPEIDFIERLEMNTVQGFATTGKIINLKAQIQPGLQQVEG